VFRSSLFAAYTPYLREIHFAFPVASKTTFRMYAFNSISVNSHSLLAICLSLLTRMLWLELSSIDFEEVDRLLWMLASDIVEGTGGDVVRLAFSNQRVVLEQILDLGSIRRCLRVQDPLCLGPKISSAKE
jgi:hypothetical protein